MYFITPERSTFVYIIQTAESYEFALRSAAASKNLGYYNTTAHDGAVASKTPTPMAPAMTKAVPSSKPNFQPRNRGHNNPQRSNTVAHLLASTAPKAMPHSVKTVTTPASGRKLRCWTCSNEGHTSKDPVCPNYGQSPRVVPQLQAG